MPPKIVVDNAMRIPPSTRRRNISNAPAAMLASGLPRAKIKACRKPIAVQITPTPKNRLVHVSARCSSCATSSIGASHSSADTNRLRLRTKSSNTTANTGRDNPRLCHAQFHNSPGAAGADSGRSSQISKPPPASTAPSAPAPTPWRKPVLTVTSRLMDSASTIGTSCAGRLEHQLCFLKQSVGAVITRRVLADLDQAALLVSEFGFHRSQHACFARTGLGTIVVVARKRHELDVEIPVIEFLRLSPAQYSF